MKGYNTGVRYIVHHPPVPRSDTLRRQWGKTERCTASAVLDASIHAKPRYLEGQRAAKACSVGLLLSWN